MTKGRKLWEYKFSNCSNSFFLLKKPYSVSFIIYKNNKRVLKIIKIFRSTLYFFQSTLEVLDFHLQNQLPNMGNRLEISHHYH